MKPSILFSGILMLPTLFSVASFGGTDWIGPSSPAPFGTHAGLLVLNPTTNPTQQSIREAGGPLIFQSGTTNTLLADPLQASTSASLDAVSPVLKTHASSSGGARTLVQYEFWDSTRISGTCPLSGDPGDLAPCLEFRWKVQGKLSAFGTGGIPSANIHFETYINCGFGPPGGCGGGTGLSVNETSDSSAHCDSASHCVAETDVSRNGSYLLSTTGVSPGTFRDGSTVGWGGLAWILTFSYGAGNGAEAAFDDLKRGVSLVILSRNPATKIAPSASAIASGKGWKQEFGRWDVVHCPPFTPDVPSSEFTVAYLPARYKGGISHLTIEQIQDRTEYVTDYYYQQSMCSVLITPWIVTDQNTDGWLNLPKTEAEYNPPPAVDTTAQLPRLASVWLDAFVAASKASPEFLLRQQTPPPFGGFDAVVVIENTDPQAFRARNFISKPIADRLPIYAGGALGVLGLGLSFHAAVAPPELLVAGVTGAFAAVFPTGLELSAILPGFLATLDNTLFKQGSVILGDTDGTGVWAHELGHSLFGFWDYYGTPEPFVRGNTLACAPPPLPCLPTWALMSSGNELNPPPVNTYDKALAGWLTNVAPVGFGDYSLVALKDTRFGSAALRFTPPRGPIDFFIIELRTPPDDVPVTPEKTGEDVPNFGNQGVIIYADHEPRGLDIPRCGSMAGELKLTLAELMGPGWLSCLDKVTNSGVPALAAPNKFTLVPNTSYTDSESGVVFTLDDQLVLSIKPL